MGLSLKNKLSAWNGIFTQGQMQEIKNMLIHAKNLGIDLYDALSISPPAVKKGLVKKAKKTFAQKCPKCGKLMQSSEIFTGSAKYKEGFRTYFLCGVSCCNNKGCGYEEYSKLSIDELKARRANG